MKLRTQLNQDRYRWLATDESKDERAFALVEIEAPAITSSKEASPTNLVAVLDRSGSMSGERLDHARRALCDIVDRLAAQRTWRPAWSAASRKLGDWKHSRAYGYC